MIQTCLAGEDLIVYKDVIRDYVHASDVAEAFRKASEVNNLPPCLNIGSGETASNEFLAEYIIKKTKSNSKIILKENRKIVKECWADISLAKKVLKHTPKKGIEQGINEAIQETKDEYQR